MKKESVKFLSSEIENYKKWAKVTVKKWHDKIEPKYILFLGEESVLMSPLLKETWRNAYPLERVPKFVEKLCTKIENSNAPIIIYDKTLGSYSKKEFFPIKSLRRIVWNGKKMKDVQEHVCMGKNLVPVNKNLTNTYNSLMEKAGARNIWIEQSSPEAYQEKIGVFSFINEKNLKNVQSLGLVGMKAGKEIRQKNEFITAFQNNWVIILALMCIFESFYFLSSNITGNAVANLTQISANIWGVVLFLTGLAGCYYFTRKK